MRRGGGGHCSLRVPPRGEGVSGMAVIVTELFWWGLGIGGGGGTEGPEMTK